jgi:hypothetical protein
MFGAPVHAQDLRSLRRFVLLEQNHQPARLVSTPRCIDKKGNHEDQSSFDGGRGAADDERLCRG